MVSHGARNPRDADTDPVTDAATVTDSDGISVSAGVAKRLPATPRPQPSP